MVLLIPHPKNERRVTRDEFLLPVLSGCIRMRTLSNCETSLLISSFLFSLSVVFTRVRVRTPVWDPTYGLAVDADDPKTGNSDLGHVSNLTVNLPLKTLLLTMNSSCAVSDRKVKKLFPFISFSS